MIQFIVLLFVLLIAVTTINASGLRRALSSSTEDDNTEVPIIATLTPLDVSEDATDFVNENFHKDYAQKLNLFAMNSNGRQQVHATNSVMVEVGSMTDNMSVSRRRTTSIEQSADVTGQCQCM